MRNRKLIKDNVDTVVRILFKYYELDYDRYANYLHHSHPLYPSIQSVSYIGSLYGLDYSLIQTDCEEVNNLPSPFVTMYDGLLLPVNSVDEDGTFIIINEEGQKEKTNLKYTDPYWSKMVLVFNKDGIAQCDSLAWKTRWWLERCSQFFVGGILFISLSFVMFHHVRHNGLFTSLLLLTSLIGVVISVLFHEQKLNRNNPFINKLCHSNKQSSRRDCSSILDSRASEVLGIVSWVDVGTIYFLLFLCIVLTYPSNNCIQLLALISICSSLYIPYSLLYQKYLARKWCTLCLIVQAILFLNAFFSFLYLKHNLINLEGFSIAALQIFLNLIIITAIYFLLIPIVYKSSEQHKSNALYRKVLFSKSGLSMLVFSTKKYNPPPASKIDLIVKDGTNNVLLVANPKCSPCINKLRKILTIISRKRYTSLSIVFLTDEGDTDSINLAKYLIIESMQKDAYQVLKAYADSFPSFKRTSIDDSSSVISIIQSHRKWCRDNEIDSTPQVLVNGHILPSMYSIDDLDYLID